MSALLRAAADHGYHGPDSFSYTLTDAAGACATGLVSITVWPAPLISEIARAPGDTIRLRFDTIPGRLCQVEASQDFAAWSVVGSAAEVIPGRYEFVDTDAVAFSNRFYRVSVR